MNLFPDGTDPLIEQKIKGDDDSKILIIPVSGIISDSPKKGLLSSRPSTVQQVVSRLELAKKDPDIKAVILKVNSPGGTITASDIIYNELIKFKKETNIKIVVSMMDIAASGGYYVSLAGDYIMAHPTTLTGSVGVIVMRPKVKDLLDKIGVSVEVSKSGRNKDMGSPFKEDSKEQTKIINSIVNSYANRFKSLVLNHRKIADKNKDAIFSAQIFSADQAVTNNLIDSTGYLDNAIDKACELAKIPHTASVVAYKQKNYPNDTLYNQMDTKVVNPTIINLEDMNILPPKAGFYYLWYPSAN